MTTTFETLPAVKCATWCEKGTGHTDEVSIVHQSCYGSVTDVKLTRMPLKIYADEHGTRSQWFDSLQANLVRNHEGRPFMHLGRNDGIGVELTLDEVRELRDALTGALIAEGLEA
jgi:hypothetical protein